ncbi:uncharacterized protein [Littorina saxatilis]
MTVPMLNRLCSVICLLTTVVTTQAVLYQRLSPRESRGSEQLTNLTATLVTLKTNASETEAGKDNKRTRLGRRRRKRFDYEDNYEWEDEEDLTYEDYYDEEEEPGFFLKVATHWRTAGPRMVCFGAFVLLVIIIFCGCARLACRYWCNSMSETSACCFMPGVKAMCQSCYTDPMYERVKEMGELMGIEISFTTYEMIKERYTPDTGFDPTSALIF